MIDRDERMSSDAEAVQGDASRGLDGPTTESPTPSVPNDPATEEGAPSESGVAPEAEKTEDIDPERKTTEPSDRLRVVRPARKALDRIRSGVTTASGATVDRVGQAMVGVERSWNERPVARIRRIRRLGAEPLLYLYDVHPEARAARPVDVGLVTIDPTDIAGTAVGGGAQRGGDFLPLKAFRGMNWQGRWQRLRQAQNDLAVLPPIDVVRYGDKYWVVDGHNRVGLALYGGQVGIDANVVELVPPGQHRTEPILPLAPTVAASQGVRAAGRGQKPSHALAHEDAVSIEPPEPAE